MLGKRQITAGMNVLRKFGFRYTVSLAGEYLLAEKVERLKGSIYKRRKPDSPVVRRNILGHIFELNMNDTGIHRDLFLDGIREPVATAEIMSILSKDDVVLEIGANIGYYALIEARICKHVYAVEPHPDNVRSLERHVELNNYKNIEIHPVAIGSHTGTAALNVSDKSNWHTFVERKGKTRQIEVPMFRGDDFLKDKRPVNFLRMDVEGYELEVLKGLKETLGDNHLKRIFLELHGDVLATEEIQKLLDILKNSSFCPELIVQHDRPMLSKIMHIDHLNKKIYQGDRGTYELFFKRQ